ncbi:MAG: hypothetical protein H8E36_04860 [Rhodospirillaceae bacterium]|nr:hypothetical protein [Rhodospirillaceae bacterium]
MKTFIFNIYCKYIYKKLYLLIQWIRGIKVSKSDNLIDDGLLNADEAVEPFGEWPVEVSADIEEHIKDADSWATDWRLFELDFESETRQAEHQKYLAALHKVCSDYNNQVLKEFPLGVARWLAQEANNVCEDLPSQVLKCPEEGVSTANFAQENRFGIIREEWEKQDRNPAFILQALVIAKELGVQPPSWVLDPLIEAGVKVYKNNGALMFGEALGLTPNKIEKGRTRQRKMWIADLVAEAIDGNLSQSEAKELAIFEAEIVFGWQQYKPGTVQKYYEDYANEREGFSQSFMESLEWFELIEDPVFQSTRLPYWRRKVLLLRLEAYREAMEFYPDTKDAHLDRVKRHTHVTTKTIAGLRRNEPPRNSSEHFIDTDF